MHTSSLFSYQFPDGDRGGNSFWIKPKGAVKLHSYWDGLMGRSTSTQNVLNEAALIKATHKKNNLTTDLNPVSWSKEGFKLAREKVYLNGELKGSNKKEDAMPLPDHYGRDSKMVGESQISLAGHRLAKFLAI